MASPYDEYERVLLRIPQVKRAHIYEERLGQAKINVLTESTKPAQLIIREVLSALKSSGWASVEPDQIVVIQVQPESTTQQAPGRLLIVGYSLSHGTEGVNAQCRLARGDQQYEGSAVAPRAIEAVANAALRAVNASFGQTDYLQLVESSVVEAGGVKMMITVVSESNGEVLVGSAIVHGPMEETVVRSALDAINRRFVLYTGHSS